MYMITWTTYCLIWVAFTLIKNNFVASKVACELQSKGFVNKSISSQFVKEGIILKDFGNLPVLYLVRYSPILNKAIIKFCAWNEITVTILFYFVYTFLTWGSLTDNECSIPSII